MLHGDLTTEMLWVLRSARRHADDPRLRSASGFAAGAGRAPAVHRAQVGRWENGSVEISHDLVRRYEQVLGLPEGQLLCVIDVFSRSLLPTRATTALHPREPPDVDATLELLERALSTERMTGLDWDRLSSNLGRMSHALVRASDWEHLIRRCNQEIGVSLNLDFGQRYGAVVRFVRHPRSGAIVAQMAADILRDPAAQIYADVASTLRYTTHPAAVEVLIGQLREPTNNHALRASLLAMTSLVAGGRLGPAVTVEVVRLAVEHLRDTGRPFRVRRGAANLVRAVDLPGRGRLASGLTVDNQKFAASIIMEGRALNSGALRELQVRVRRSLEEALPPKEAHDPVLTTVLSAAIGETNEETRGNALAVLMLSPQGRVVGMTYAAELGDALRRGDRVAAHECLTALSWLMQPEALDPLTDLACDPDVSVDLAYEAANTVGNCWDRPGPTGEVRELRVRDRFAEVVRTAGSLASVEPALRGLAYALGMRARNDLIDELAVDLESGELSASAASVVAKARSILAWWQDIPVHIRPLR